MAAPTIIDYTLISKGMFRFLGNIGVFFEPILTCGRVWWEDLSSSRENPSPCEMLLPDRHLAVTQLQQYALIRPGKLQESGGRPEVSLLCSFLRVGERGSSVGAFMLSFYVLVLIWRLFILFAFLCSKNIECLLSAYSDRKMFKHWSLNTSNNCSFLVGT